jgi:hypothetical protein
MKSLGRTIDRILKVVPNMDTQLLPIKSKWERYPSRTMKYWQELGTVLNTIKNHPRWSEIRNIVLPKKKTVRVISSFEPPVPNERVLGIIPEYISDKIRRHDRASIVFAKKRVEVSMTKDTALLAQLFRKECIMEIQMKKIWCELKDHFKLWDKPVSYGIRKQDPFLVLVIIPDHPPIQMMPGSNGQAGMMRMDENTFRKFMGMLGMEPPPDMAPPLPPPPPPNDDK